MKKNKISRFIALIALLSIVIWIVWTGILIVFSPTASNNSIDSLTQEQLQELIKFYSTWWTTADSWSLNLSWSLNQYLDTDLELISSSWSQK